MIECVSTVILPGCGPEVCVTSKKTRSTALRRQADGNRGRHRRREQKETYRTKGGVEEESRRRQELSSKAQKLLL